MSKKNDGYDWLNDRSTRRRQPQNASKHTWAAARSWESAVGALW
mgnify:CR=1 FL=1